MILDSEKEVGRYLVNEQLLDSESEAEISRLTGGVSCRVWKVVSLKGRWVLKQALEKLEVQADWFSDIERIHREHQAMEQIGLIIPDSNVPKVLHADYVNHVYMMTCAEEGAQTWKDLMMQGVFNKETAKSAAKTLSLIHSRSYLINDSLKEEFSNQKYFDQLRIDPFHRFLIQKYPELSKPVNRLIDELSMQKTCLVHGDFSPKNMLVKQDGEIVLIDFEVAHWGNPVFDLAYCLGHLMLKAWHLKKYEEMLELIRSFLDHYTASVNNLLCHLGLMLLARMDGKSPVSYIQNDELKQVIRTRAIEWLNNEDPDADVWQAIRSQFEF